MVCPLWFWRFWSQWQGPSWKANWRKWFSLRGASKTRQSTGDLAIQFNCSFNTILNYLRALGKVQRKENGCLTNYRKTLWIKDWQLVSLYVLDQKNILTWFLKNHTSLSSYLGFFIFDSVFNAQESPIFLIFYQSSVFMIPCFIKNIKIYRTI